MKTIFLLLLTVSAFIAIPAQTGQVIGVVEDAQLRKRIVDARVELTNPCMQETLIDSTDANGLFHFTFKEKCDTLKIRATHNQEDCDGTHFPWRGQLTGKELADTIHIKLAHVWVDYNLPALYFQGSSLRFWDQMDSTVICNLADSVCPEIKAFNRFKWLYDCDHFSKVELICDVTNAELQLYGDTLARQRVEKVIGLMARYGIPETIFVVRIQCFEDRPIKKADGTFADPVNAIFFRVLSY